MLGDLVGFLDRRHVLAEPGEHRRDARRRGTGSAAASADSASSPGMNRRTARRANHSFGSRSRSQRLPAIQSRIVRIVPPRILAVRAFAGPSRRRVPGQTRPRLESTGWPDSSTSTTRTARCPSCGRSSRRSATSARSSSSCATSSPAQTARRDGGSTGPAAGRCTPDDALARRRGAPPAPPPDAGRHRPDAGGRRPDRRARRHAPRDRDRPDRLPGARQRPPGLAVLAARRRRHRVVARARRGVRRPARPDRPG